MFTKHGLEQIYKTLEEADAQAGKKTDLLLICGDFQVCSFQVSSHGHTPENSSSFWLFFDILLLQAVRYHGDLQSLAVPDKYRQLGDFHK